MSKNVYQHSAAVAAYDRSHGISSQGVLGGSAAAYFERLASWVFSACPEAGKISVLDIGVGHGGVLFIPLVERLKNAGRLASAVAIDNSRPMLDELERRWARHIAEPLEPVQSLQTSSAKPFCYLLADAELVLADAETFDSVNRFEVVILTGTLHHFLNWRAGLWSVVTRLLTPNGMIVLGERDSDSDFIDGNFYQELRDSNWRNLWVKVYEWRDDCSVPWDPELRASDLTPAVLFLRTIGFADVPGSPLHGHWSESYQESEIAAWVSHPVFANFSRGLTASDRRWLQSKVVEEMSRCVTIAGSTLRPFDVTESWRYYAMMRQSCGS